MTAFQRKKKDILATLSAPDESYTDLSPKGSVDSGIRELVEEINEHEELVTTSSCAGRIAVYVEGLKATERSDGLNLSSGGKGGGRWLFVSHDPVTYDQLDDEQLMSVLCLRSETTNGPKSSHISHVRFKFEPMILHILCSSISIARKVLGAALSAGFRESGISSINDEGDMVMVGIRTHGLAFDSVIGLASGGDDAMIDMLVSTEYLRTLLRISRERFLSNTARKGRFADALLKSLSEQPPAGRDPNWEPADARRARKRAEGLARQKRLAKDSSMDHGAEGDGHDLPVTSLFRDDD